MFRPRNLPKDAQILLILAAFFFMLAGFFFSRQFSETPNTAQTPNEKNPLNFTANPKNGIYTIEREIIVLNDGVSEIEAMPGSASKIITQYFGNEAHGDFNGDGREDTVFLLTQNTGGTGTFFYAVAALKTESGYQGTNAILLGDRIAPQTIEFRNGEIIVNYAERKPDEPMTARPSIGISKYLIVENGKLREITNGGDL